MFNLDLARMIRDQINPSLEFVDEPLPMDDPLQRQLVIRLAENELGGVQLPSHRRA